MHENDLLKWMGIQQRDDTLGGFAKYLVEDGRHRLAQRRARDPATRWYMLTGVKSK